MIFMGIKKTQEHPYERRGGVDIVMCTDPIYYDLWISACRIICPPLCYI
jgi:hypothetical protein